jgi:glucose/arabinose dehydrogenase
MGILKHTTPVVLLLIFLLTARQIYPYTEPLNAEAIEGFEINKIASGLGGPTCLDWVDDHLLLMCDRDDGRILLLNASDNFSQRVLISGLDHPHDVHLTEEHMYVSEEGALAKYTRAAWSFENRTVLIDGVPSGNHQTNAINAFPNGTLIWHSGSTCNVCSESDERNAALLWVNPETGDHGVLASGVRNSFDGVWVEGVGYIFSDNGRDLEGNHPEEELNMLVNGAAYGWPDDDPDHPVPEGTLAPIAGWTPHTSLNGLVLRPEGSPFPGLNASDGNGFTLYGTVYGSWNTILPQGHEILQIDFTPTGDTNATEPAEAWSSKITRFATDLGTPLPIIFAPDGTMYYATFGSGGALYQITPPI